MTDVVVIHGSLGCSAEIEDLAAISVPVMIVASDRDQIMPWAETLAIGKLIPACEIAMFYGAAHPLAAVPVLPIARTVGAWMEKVAKRP